MDKPRYEICYDYTANQTIQNRPTPSCLPYGIDKTNFVDITRVGDLWRVYMDSRSGRIHNGADYYQEYLNNLNIDKTQYI